MSTVMRECERIARTEGLAAGLSRMLSGAAAPDRAAPGRWAAVPRKDVPEGTEVRTHRLADAEGIVFVRCPAGGSPSPRELAETARLLTAVRLGVVRRLLDTAVEHLAGRESGGEPLVRKQLVTGAVADVMAGVELLRAQAESGSGEEPSALADLQTQLDDLGWQVAKLFGAAGYIADHPARALHVSALVAGTWVSREEVTA